MRLLRAQINLSKMLCASTLVQIVESFTVPKSLVFKYNPAMLPAGKLHHPCVATSTLVQIA
jgi:hypothetical protein